MTRVMKNLIMALNHAAADVIGQVLTKKMSLKSAIYESQWRAKPVLAAVVTETLKFKEILQEIADEFQLCDKEKISTYVIKPARIMTLKQFI